jgi:ascorbate-specific PTS system EIIC-type component UlaA
MSDEFEEKFIKPIVNACYPGTLAGLDLAVLQITLKIPAELRYVLLTGAFFFLLSAFSIFSYTIYPARKKLWTLSAIAFLVGLSCSMLAAIMAFWEIRG